MATSNAFYFDTSSLKTILEMQDRINSALSSSAFFEIQRGLKQSTLLETMQAYSKLANSGMLASMSELTRQTSQILQSSQAFNSLQTIHEQLTPILQQLHEQSWIWEIVPSLDMSLRNAISVSYSGLTRTEMNKGIITNLEKLSSLDFSTNVEVANDKKLTDSDRIQLCEDLTEALTTSPDWLESIVAKLAGYKPKMAQIAYDIIIGLIIELILHSFAWAATTVKSAVVREEPSTSSTVITRIEGAYDIEVIGDAPYYYFVEFRDSQTGEIVQGYISKRMVTPPTSDTSHEID